MNQTNFGKIMNDRKPSNKAEAFPENEAETIRELHDVIEDKWDQRVRRPTREETSRRYTFLMDRDLYDRLDKIAKEKLAEAGGKPGFKTMALNAMIRRCLNEYEE